jgi:hypothetical protein
MTAQLGGQSMDLTQEHERAIGDAFIGLFYASASECTTARSLGSCATRFCGCSLAGTAPTGRHAHRDRESGDGYRSMTRAKNGLSRLKATAHI